MRAKISTNGSLEVFPKLMCLKADPRVVVLFFDSRQGLSLQYFEISCHYLPDHWEDFSGTVTITN